MLIIDQPWLWERVVREIIVGVILPDFIAFITYWDTATEETGAES